LPCTETLPDAGAMESQPAPSSVETVDEKADGFKMEIV
jgi:hypothetical protein